MAETSLHLAPPSGRIDMVLDADMYNDVDDQFALAFAVRSPERINLKAVYAVPFKNQRSKSPGEGMEKSYHETFRVLKLLNYSGDGIVFRGSKQYLPDRKTPVDSPAARHLIKLAHEPRDGRLYVVGLGAASNLASALLIDPSITNRIVVVWIGGQPHSWKSALDFNLKQDIAAAQVLFDSGVPLVHVPARVAVALVITLPELEAGLKNKSPIGDALYQNVEKYYVEVDPNKKAPRSGPGVWQKVIWTSRRSRGCWNLGRWSGVKWFQARCWRTTETGVLARTVIKSGLLRNLTAIVSTKSCLRNWRNNGVDFLDCCTDLKL